MTRIETTILGNLLHNEPYLRTVIPFLKDEYFISDVDRKVFKLIQDFTEKYNAPPTQEALVILVQNDRNLNEEEYKSLVECVEELTPPKQEPNLEWLIDESEKFCKDRAIYNAIRQAIYITEGKDKQHGPDAIPEILQDALSVCFDTNIGHDYLENFEERFDFYHQKEDRIPFDLEMLNKITKGGTPKKTLNVILAGTNVGKSLVMCHMAAANLSMGKNVLYITLEMAEERIAERIDANLLNISIDELPNIPKDLFNDRIGKVQSKTHGKLIIKEYPTASAHAAHFRALLHDLKIKKNFVPDIIYIDYINICASSRYKASAQVNPYIFVKAIAEELRGLGVEFKVPIWTATQTNREGFSNSDVELTETAESFGLPATADFMIAIIETEELEQLGQYMVKQLKNRYNQKTSLKRFVIGVDKTHMRLYDVDSVGQQNIMKEPEAPTFIPPRSKTKKDFSGIKV